LTRGSWELLTLPQQLPNSTHPSGGRESARLPFANLTPVGAPLVVALFTAGVFANPEQHARKRGDHKGSP